jgi:lactoylglutathione lyase
VRCRKHADCHSAAVVARYYHTIPFVKNNPFTYQRNMCLSMPKIIHTMIRVFDPERSIRFYSEGFGFAISHRLDFDDFSLIYLRNPENDFEIELTHNKGRTEPYTHGDGYGHYAFVVEELEPMQSKLEQLGYSPLPIKEFKRGDELLARFFFVQDPDGYKIEVLQRGGHYR